MDLLRAHFLTTLKKAVSYWEQAVNAQGRKSTTNTFISLCAIYILSALFVIIVGPVPQNIYGHDTPLLFDGAWRILQGQIPNADFHSALGPLTFLVIALGMKISSLSVNSITYAIVIISLPALALSWVSAYRKTSAFYSFLFCLFIIFTLIGTHYPGNRISDTTYSGYYNRFASAYFFILLLETCLPDRTNLSTGIEKWNDALSGIIVGICFAFLFFIKISYFGMACFAIVFSIYIVKRSNPILWIIYVFFGVGFISIPMIFYLKMGIIHYFRDLQLAASARLSFPMVMLIRILVAFFRNYFFIGCMGLFIWMWNTCNVVTKKKLFLTVGFLVTISLIIFSTNSVVPGPEKELPTLAIPMFITLEYTRRSDALNQFKINFSNRLIWWFSSQIGLILILVFIIRDIASFAYTVYWRFNTLPNVTKAERFQSKALYDLINTSPNFPFKNMEVTQSSYTELVNDGLSLLKENISNSDRVTVLDFTNPFCFGLLQPSPQGDALWWDVNFTFSKDAFVSAKEIFSTVTVVMVNRYSIESDAIMEVYQDYVFQHYRLKVQSKFWDLYILK